MASFLFTNAALLDPLKPDLLEDHSVLIEDGLVKEVSDRPLMSAAARTIDLKGKTLMPGLIDLHVHTIAIQYNLPGQVTLPNVFVTLKALPVLQGGPVGTSFPAWPNQDRIEPGQSGHQRLAGLGSTSV
jgi:predicted amidohydrolase YtcJ